MILPIFLFSFSALGMTCPQDNACPARLQEQSSTEQFSTEKSLKIVEVMKKDKDFQSFLADFLRQKDAVLRDTGFQDFVSDLQEQIQTQAPFQIPSQQKNKEGHLYIFVSFSLGEKALLNLANEAKHDSKGPDESKPAIF